MDPNRSQWIPMDPNGSRDPLFPPCCNLIPSRLPPTKSPGEPPGKREIPGVSRQGVPGELHILETPQNSPGVPKLESPSKIFRNFNFSGDSGGGFLESP